MHEALRECMPDVSETRFSQLTFPFTLWHEHRARAFWYQGWLKSHLLSIICRPRTTLNSKSTWEELGTSQICGRMNSTVWIPKAIIVAPTLWPNWWKKCRLVPCAMPQPPPPELPLMQVHKGLVTALLFILLGWCLKMTDISWVSYFKICFELIHHKFLSLDTVLHFIGHCSCY